MRHFSHQTLEVLQVLARVGSSGCHGLEVARETGLKSGTLYPILMRLADRGLLSHEWQAPVRAGLPPRHLYCLTAVGHAALADAIAMAGSTKKALA
jgi:PadR family transcriptional regulator PadR